MRYTHGGHGNVVYNLRRHKQRCYADIISASFFKDSNNDDETVSSLSPGRSNIHMADCNVEALFNEFGVR